MHIGRPQILSLAEGGRYQRTFLVSLTQICYLWKFTLIIPQILLNFYPPQLFNSSSYQITFCKICLYALSDVCCFVKITNRHVWNNSKWDYKPFKTCHLNSVYSFFVFSKGAIYLDSGPMTSFVALHLSPSIIKRKQKWENIVNNRDYRP